MKIRLITLGDKALSEGNVDRLIQCLLERKPCTADLINHRVGLDENEAQVLLLIETKILERLKEERIKVLEAMEKLSRSRKASRVYSPRFPFPSMPAFVDKSE